MSDTTLGMVECSCKKTKVAPGHFCPHCLWVNTDPETTPLQNPPPDAERVSLIRVSVIGTCLAMAKFAVATGQNEKMPEKWRIEEAEKELQQLRARPALDLEKVTNQVVAKLKTFNYEDLFDGSDEVRQAIRTILKTALGEKE